MLPPPFFNQKENSPIDAETFSVKLQRDRQLRMLFETAFDAIALADHQGRYLDVNPAACQLLGIERKKLIGRFMAEFILSDFSPVWQQFLAGEKVHGKWKIKGGDGETRWVEYIGQNNFSAEGSLWVMRTITQWTEGKLEIAGRQQAEPEEIKAENREAGFTSISLAQKSILQDINLPWVSQRVNGDTFDLFSQEMNVIDRQFAEANFNILFKKLAEIKFALDQAAIVVITDAQGTIKYVNDKFCQVSKYSKSELIGQNHRLLNSGHHPPEFFRNLWQTISQGQVWQGEIKNKAKDGTTYWVDTTIVPFFNDHGKPIQYLAIRFDITPRKQAEAKIQELLNRTQLLNAIGVLIRNSLELETILSNAVKAIYAEIGGADVCTFGWYRCHNYSPVFSVEIEEKKPGLPSWLRTECLDDSSPISSHILQHKIYQFSGREALENEKIKQFCQNYGVNAYLCLPIHTAGGEIGAIEMGKIDSSPWTEEHIQLLQEIANQIAIALYQSQLYRESQKANQELSQAYQELQKAQTRLIQAEKMSSLGELVAGIAHEINNPVSFIYGNIAHAADYTDDLIQLIRLYQEYYPQPAKAIADFAEDIDIEYLVRDFSRLLKSMKTGATRIANIVKSLRTFSRLDEAEFKAIDIHENIESTLVILQNRFSGTGKEIKVVKNYGQLPLVKCYGGLLNQVFMNLLANAIDAIEQRHKDLLNMTNNLDYLDYVGQITITTFMSVNSVSNEPVVNILIRDNGCGMSPEVQAKIFDPFFTTKPVGKGTGMGLAISYQIITENHQGSLGCVSTLGEGTELAIALPIT